MLNRIRKDIDKSLESFLKETATDLVPLKSSSLLYEGIRDFSMRKGKRIRPALFLISYQGYTKKRNYSRKKLLKCSLSLELLHNFLLVHDDIIDNADLRRGKPAMHRVFNKRMGLSAENKTGSDLGIVAGDIIFALAVKALLSLDENTNRKEKALDIFIKTAASTGIGEFLDVMNNTKRIGRMSEKDIMNTYILKTSKYTFEGPLLIGATLAGAPRKEKKTI